MTPTRPQLAGTFGMVASTHWLASAAGMAVLEGGGNAFDAAVATGFVLQVVEPHLNGPGGEVPIIFATADSGRPTVLCGQGPAPAKATIGHYRGLGLTLIPGAGPLAAAVPGAVEAWLTLLRDHGTRSLGEVLGYAIWYAERGHPLLSRAVETMARRSCSGTAPPCWPAAHRAVTRGPVVDGVPALARGAGAGPSVLGGGGELAQQRRTKLVLSARYASG